ncbi:MAG: thermonuclease family protein [Planctomycetaceae bacterium]|nr:thermonuclease family protein [Planctomycetaceae bacterium]
MIDKLAIVLAALVLLASSALADPYVAYLEGVEAEEIDDGDTPLIEIRMYGIDAPEKAQLCERANGVCYKCGQRSKWVLSGLLTDEATYRFTGESTYGRPVATIFLNQLNINLEMVRLGHAIVYESFLDDDQKAEYLAIQQEAKDKKRGIWQGKFIEPAKWRKGERLACEQN